MRFLRRKERAEPIALRCPVCKEPLPEAALTCQMCGHPVPRMEIGDPHALETLGLRGRGGT